MSDVTWGWAVEVQIQVSLPYWSRDGSAGWFSKTWTSVPCPVFPTKEEAEQWAVGKILSEEIPPEARVVSLGVLRE